MSSSQFSFLELQFITGKPPDCIPHNSIACRSPWQSCEGQGLVLQVYIQAGKQAFRAVEKEKFRTVIARMRPLLREQKYDSAVEGAVIDLGLVLAGANLQPADEGNDVAGLAIFLGIFGAVIGFVSW